MSPSACPQCGSLLAAVDGRCPICKGDKAPTPAAPTRRVQLFHTALAIGVVFAFADFSMPCMIGAFERSAPAPSARNVINVIGFAFVGGLLGQLGMLAAWVVFAPQGLGARLLVSALTIAALCLMLMVGIGVHDADLEEMLPVFLCAPLVWIAAQAPLWTVRLLRQWRLAPLDEEEDDQQPLTGQMRTRDLFLAMGVVALALTLARIGFALQPYRPVDGSADATLWMVLLVACGICFGSAALSTLPCIFAMLRSSQPRQASLLVAGAALVVVFVGAVVFAFVAMAPAADIIPFCIGIAGGLFGVQFVCLYVVRNCGYRMVRG